MPYGIQVDAAFNRIDQRNQFGLPTDSFLFLSMFDTHSTSQRKNPRGAIEAFKKAFAPGRTDVGLVIKIHNSGAFPGEVERLRAELEGYSNIFLMERTLTRMEVYGLIDACDAFVSLHRSEGFGLVMAEAMYMGKPVIGTLWSGNTEFMNEWNSCAVRYTLVQIQSDAGPYRASCTWAEPDSYHAASYMARLVQDGEYYRMISEQGKATIRDSFSLQASGARIRQRLTELGHM
jgi:glycosyltransferase involved in cell wall biosynthesis